MPVVADACLDLLRSAIVPLSGGREDYDALLAMCRDARFVLLGEATHGTHEFYRERAQITKQLIKEHGFSAVAVEADWPDASRVHRFVRGQSDDGDAEEALQEFKRFPIWMWRNADVLDFVGWLREHNDRIAEPGRRVGFYGMDLYSLNSSIQAVLSYLKEIDPEEARRARARYSCFEHFGVDPQSYGIVATSSPQASCEEEVIRQLIELRRRAPQYTQRKDRLAAEEYFLAEQNARLIKNAEHYYRAMYHGRASTWNLRDQHMTETVEALVREMEKQGQEPKIVIWAHNSHLGDARATEMGHQGELNVGQLLRERYGSEALLVGFTTHGGSVTAASEWEGPAERKLVRPALPASYEALFHELGEARFFLNVREHSGALPASQLERAIGVIYLPESERSSHYFQARLAGQFDALFHFDETRAVEPLERTARWRKGEVPETYPFSV